MKKIFALTIAFIAGIALTANAGSITPGQMTKCNDAKSITLSTAGCQLGTSRKFSSTTQSKTRFLCAKCASVTAGSV